MIFIEVNFPPLPWVSRFSRSSPLAQGRTREKQQSLRGAEKAVVSDHQANWQLYAGPNSYSRLDYTWPRWCNTSGGSRRKPEGPLTAIAEAPKPITVMNTADPPITTSFSTFHYNIDEMPSELKSCLYRLAYDKIGFLYVVLLKVAEFIDNMK